MMKELSQMPNIEKALEEKLIILGITSPDDLSWVGSKEAFYRISLIFPQDACLNLLYSLEGAIRGKQWSLLKTEVRKDLANFYRLLNFRLFLSPNEILSSKNNTEIRTEIRAM